MKTKLTSSKTPRGYMTTSLSIDADGKICFLAEHTTFIGYYLAKLSQRKSQLKSA